MIIRELLELTQQEPIAEIAKKYLTIGEKPARQALKRSGCYTIVGQAGWTFDDTENPENLDRSIYDFAKEVHEERKMELKDAANAISQDENYVPRKRHSFDLDVRLVKELKLYCVREDKTLYEVVEGAIRDYLSNPQHHEDGQGQ